jgi:hypothetical protein
MNITLNSRFFCKGSSTINRELFHATGEGLNNLLVRRIVSYVDRTGHFDYAPETPVWQECCRTARGAEWSNLNGFLSLKLEEARKALPADAIPTSDSAPIFVNIPPEVPAPCVLDLRDPKVMEKFCNRHA